jgi:hypothetical protein
VGDAWSWRTTDADLDRVRHRLEGARLELPSSTTEVLSSRPAIAPTAERRRAIGALLADAA